MKKKGRSFNAGEHNAISRTAEPKIQASNVDQKKSVPIATARIADGKIYDTTYRSSTHQWQHTQEENEKSKHILYNVVNMINTQSDKRNDNSKNDKLVEGLIETAKAPWEYAIHCIVFHICKGQTSSMLYNCMAIHLQKRLSDRKIISLYTSSPAIVAGYEENEGDEDLKNRMTTTNPWKVGNRSEFNAGFHNASTAKTRGYLDEEHDRNRTATSKTVKDQPYS